MDELNIELPENDLENYNKLLNQVIKKTKENKYLYDFNYFNSIVKLALKFGDIPTILKLLEFFIELECFIELDNLINLILKDEIGYASYDLLVLAQSYIQSNWSIVNKFVITEFNHGLDQKLVDKSTSFVYWNPTSIAQFKILRKIQINVGSIKINFKNLKFTLEPLLLAIKEYFSINSIDLYECEVRIEFLLKNFLKSDSLYSEFIDLLEILLSSLDFIKFQEETIEPLSELDILAFKDRIIDRYLESLINQ